MGISHPAFHHEVFRDLVLRQNGIATSSQFPPSYLQQSRTHQIIAGNVICQMFGTLFVLARAYSRLFIIGTWKSEDWVLAIAWLFATGYSICQYGQVAHGAGRHLAATTNPQDAVTSQKYAFAATLTLFEALALPKMSICLSYLRIFYSDRSGRRLIQVLMVVLVLSIIPFFIETLFTCRPLHLYWTELRPKDKCLTDLPTLYVNGSLNVAVDIALMSILMPRIIHLKLNRRQKWALISVVMLGSLAVIAGIVRMVRVGTTLGKYKTGNFDPPWDMYDVSIWTSTEVYVSLICASAPGVKPLLSKLLPRLLGTTLRSRTTGGHTNPIEMDSRMKRATLGTSGTMHKSISRTGLTAGHGPYAEVGRGIDEESIGEKSEEEKTYRANLDSGIVEKSEIVVHTGNAI